MPMFKGLRMKRLPPSGMDSMPWEKWEFNKEFFKSLSKYRKDHPETSCSRILNNICCGLENGKDLFEAILDGPLPFRGFVKALACLLKLGVTVRRTKDDVYEFAKQVASWVENIMFAFDSDANYYFTWATWRSLEEIRDLVDEICVWANTRLADGRWSRISHRLAVGKEINEFKARLADAKELFRDFSMINLSRGLDAIWRAIQAIWHRQDTITRELQKIKQQREQLSYIIDEHILMVKFSEAAGGKV